MAPVKVGGKRNAAVNWGVLSQTDLNRVYLQGDYKSSKIFVFFLGILWSAWGKQTWHQGKTCRLTARAKWAFLGRAFRRMLAAGLRLSVSRSLPSQERQRKFPLPRTPFSGSLQRLAARHPCRRWFASLCCIR